MKINWVKITRKISPSVDRKAKWESFHTGREREWIRSKLPMRAREHGLFEWFLISNTNFIRIFYDIKWQILNWREHILTCSLSHSVSLCNNVIIESFLEIVCYPIHLTVTSSKEWLDATNAEQTVDCWQSNWEVVQYSIFGKVQFLPQLFLVSMIFSIYICYSFSKNSIDSLLL